MIIRLRYTKTGEGKVTYLRPINDNYDKEGVKHATSYLITKTGERLVIQNDGTAIVCGFPAIRECRD